MAKNKKKKANKKASVKRAHPAKKSRSAKPKARKKNKEINADIIFDSKVGKTDALFVSNPEPAAPPASSPKTEIDAKPASAEATAGQGKSFWQRLFHL